METTPKTIDSRSTMLAKKFYELRKTKSKLETEMNSVDAELDQVKQELTNVMEQLELQKFSIDGLGTFYLSTNVYPKIADNDKLVQWLDEHELGNIAPRKVHMPSLKEMFEERMEKDEPVPSDLVDLTPVIGVRLRISNQKGE